jgi:hypothetical protein
LQVIENQKKELSSFESKSVNVLLDIWSTRMQESVLGLQVQIIKDWKVKLMTLGFLSFPGLHTGANIRRMVEDHLKIFGIELDKVNCNLKKSPFQNGCAT